MSEIQVLGALCLRVEGERKLSVYKRLGIIQYLHNKAVQDLTKRISHLPFSILLEYFTDKKKNILNTQLPSTVE